MSGLEYRGSEGRIGREKVRRVGGGLVLHEFVKVRTVVTRRGQGGSQRGGLGEEMKVGEIHGFREGRGEDGHGRQGDARGGGTERGRGGVERRGRLIGGRRVRLIVRSGAQERFGRAEGGEGGLEPSGLEGCAGEGIHPVRNGGHGGQVRGRGLWRRRRYIAGWRSQWRQ